MKKMTIVVLLISAVFFSTVYAYPVGRAYRNGRGVGLPYRAPVAGPNRVMPNPAVTPGRVGVDGPAKPAVTPGRVGIDGPVKPSVQEAY